MRGSVPAGRRPRRPLISATEVSSAQPGTCAWPSLLRLECRKWFYPGFFKVQMLGGVGWGW